MDEHLSHSNFPLMAVIRTKAAMKIFSKQSQLQCEQHDFKPLIIEQIPFLLQNYFHCSTFN